MKNCIILLTLCFVTYAHACLYTVRFITKTGGEYVIANDICRRSCVCVKNVNTHKIYASTDSPVTRVFRTSNCSGAYQTIKPGTTVTNMEWAGSISYGPSGTSIGPNGCPTSFVPATTI
ncbi:hypothetical protein BJ944DRAFT_269073 [Cunninghamella echinulata]|nr:hypothetical protein BJ944DRAFT_269073 [Cunninghamella echinulata]